MCQLLLVSPTDTGSLLGSRAGFALQILESPRARLDLHSPGQVWGACRGNCARGGVPGSLEAVALESPHSFSSGWCPWGFWVVEQCHSQMFYHKGLSLVQNKDYFFLQGILDLIPGWMLCSIQHCLLPQSHELLASLCLSSSFLIIPCSFPLLSLVHPGF